MKVFTLAPRENWICDRIADEWMQHNDSISVCNIFECDIIWLLAGWCWNHIPIDILRAKKVVLTVHHLVPDKMTKDKIDEFLARDHFVDCYHVPNKKTKNLITSLTSKPIKVISYWYDKEKWYYVDKNTARIDLQIPDSDFVIGSFQRDTEGSDLITPKLEKGPDRFCEFIEKNNQRNIHVLLGGFRRQYVINRLCSSNVKISYYEMAPIDTLRKMYASCDLYVISSRHEGGPQSVLEAAAMNVPIISTDVGIVSNILPDNCITNVENCNYLPSKDDVDYSFKQVKKFEIRSHKNEFIKMFNEVLGGKIS